MRLVSTADPIIEAIGDNPVVIVDTETRSLYPWRDGKVLAGVGVKPLGGESFYIPFRHPNSAAPQARLKELARLGKALRGREIVFHNAKYDLAVLWQDGLDLVDEDVADTMVIVRLVSEDEPSYALKRLAKKHIDPTAGESEKALKVLMKKAGWYDKDEDGDVHLRYDLVPAEVIASPYVDDDLCYTEGLYLKAGPFIERRGLEELYALEKRLTRALFHMERHGFKLDRDYVQREHDELWKLTLELEAQANELAKDALRKRARELGVSKQLKLWLAMKPKARAEAMAEHGRDEQRLLKAVECVRLERKTGSGKLVPAGAFDLYSSHDVKKIFEALGFESTVKTKKGGDSWAKGALEAIDHELARVVTRCRGTKNTYSFYAGFLEHMDADGVLHCSVYQAGARTGRMSCREPNLQNIPKFGADVTAVKTTPGAPRPEQPTAEERAYGLPDGSAEIPVGDEELDGELVNKDLGKVRGAFVPRPGHFLLSIDWSQIELVIFAAYAGEQDLLRTFELGLDFHKMSAIVAFGSLPDKKADPDLYSWVRRLGKNINFGLLYGMGIALLAFKLGKTKKEAQKFMDNFFAHLKRAKQWIDGVHVECEENGFVINLWGRRRYLPKQLVYKAVNFLVQGSAADLMKDALDRAVAALTGFKTELLIPIHDEMIFEIPYGEARKVVPIVVREMTTCPRIKARISCGLSWTPERWSKAEKLDCDTCNGNGRLVEIPGVAKEDIEDTLLDALYRRDRALLKSGKVSECPDCEGAGYDLSKIKEPKAA